MDPDAEKLHKIAREELYAHGRTPIEIAGCMNKALAGRELFSDYPLDDERWWFMVWQASGVSMGTTGDLEGTCTIEPTFELRQLNVQKVIAGLAIKRGRDRAGYEAPKAKAARIAPNKAPRRSRCSPSGRALAYDFRGTA